MNCFTPLRMIVAGALAMLVAAMPCVAQDGGKRVTEPGVSIRIFDVGKHMTKLRDLVPGQTPNVSKVIPQLDMHDDRGDFAPLEDYFILHADGFINITAAGRYEFELTSDDGSRLWIDNQVVIDHDGLHAATAATGAMELGVGGHPFEVHFFESSGGAELSLKWRPPGASGWTLIPPSALSCTKGEVRVTSPGRKNVIMPLSRGKPGDGQPLDAVHPSFDVAQARPDWFEPRVGGIDWLSDGRMVLCTWDADGTVYLLSNTAGNDPSKIEVKKFAAGLAEPLGMRVLGDRIYVLQKQELTELIDSDGDDVADEYRCVCSGWDVTANFHEFAFGLVERNGLFYANLAVAINPGGASTYPQVADRGSVIEISPEGKYEVVAHGLRTPNGIGFGVDNEIFIADNQGDWLPSSKIVHFKLGAFYGSRAALPDPNVKLPVTQPVVWLPHGEIGNSPSEITPLNIGPYKNQMIHGDVTHGGLKRVFAEKINGSYQGCVFRFTQGLEAGVNRVRVGPDSAIYVGGIGSTGNWGQEGKKRFGLQRLTFNGESTFEMLAVRAMSNGLEIEFTEPLAPGYGWSPERFDVQQWRYEPTKEYGGPKVDEERLTVKSASVSEDRKRVFIELEGMKPEHVLYVHLLGFWASDLHHELWSTEAWYTMNVIPSDRKGAVTSSEFMPKNNTLSRTELDRHWKLLFDGKTTNGWRGFKQEAMPKSGWEVVDGCLVCNPSNGSGGDIVTDETYRDFELSFDWKVSEGGNSGVFFRVAEDEGAVWITGPEYQVLDNDRHADGENPLTSAGSAYGMYAPSYDASLPAGFFNQSRLLVRGNHVEHYLNGAKLFEYEIGSDDWNERLARSKFASMPRYGRETSGHIALQDHGDRVWYRNIKIRPLNADE